MTSKEEQEVKKLKLTKEKQQNEDQHGSDAKTLGATEVSLPGIPAGAVKVGTCITLVVTIMCGSRKYPYSPHRRDWKFRGGGGFSRTPKFKGMYEAKLEFPEGWGCHRANPFCGGGYHTIGN